MQPKDNGATSSGDAADERISPELDASWEAEIERRISDCREGRVKTIPGEEVLAKARRIVEAAAKRT